MLHAGANLTSHTTNLDDSWNSEFASAQRARSSRTSFSNERDRKPSEWARQALSHPSGDWSRSAASSSSTATTPPLADSLSSSRLSITSAYVITARQSDAKSRGLGGKLLTMAPQALIDGTSSDPKLSVLRQEVSFSHCLLSPLVIEKLPRGARTGTVKKAWEKAKIDEQWKEGNWAKARLRTERRQQLTDFDRFKVLRLKKQRRFEERKALAKIKASA